MPPGWPPADPTKPEPELPPDWDEVDEASADSFPASDPPAWSQHRAVASPEDRLPDALRPRYAARRRRRRRILAGVALALATVAIGVAIARAAQAASAAE